MPGRTRGRPNHWYEGRRLRALWQEAHAKTGIGLRKQTELWAAGDLDGLYPVSVSSDALLKAIRRSVSHKVRTPDGKTRVVPTVLSWQVIGMGGGRSGGSATTGIKRS